MGNRISSFFSYLLHPLFMPLWCVYFLFQLPIYFNYTYPETYFHSIYACVIVNLILIPLMLSLYLKKHKVIKSLKMETSKERIIPYSISAFFYLLTYFLFSQIRFPNFYLNVFLAAGLAIIILLVFAAFNFKISAHMTGIGGFCGLLIIINLQLGLNTIIPLAISLLLAGILASSRLNLNAHNSIQIFVGFIIGLGSQLLLQL